MRVNNKNDVLHVITDLHQIAVITASEREGLNGRIINTQADKNKQNATDSQSYMSQRGFKQFNYIQQQRSNIRSGNDTDQQLHQQKQG